MSHKEIKEVGNKETESEGVNTFIAKEYVELFYRTDTPE